MKNIPLHAALLLATAGAALAQSNVSASSYTQNFNAITTTLPTGWTIGGGTSLTQASGSYTSGAAYSFTSSGDTAVGILNSGSYTTGKTIAYTLTNTTGQTINKVVIEWDYEKYRSGSRAWTFAFTAGGVAQSAGDQAYAADGGNTTYGSPISTIAKSVAVNSTSIAANGTYALNWTLNGTGGSSNGQALAIDNLNIYLGVAQLYWDGDGTGAVGGGAGTWNSSGSASPAAAWSGTIAGSSYGKWNNTAHDNTTANFGGTGGVVTLGSAVTTGGLNFTTSGYSIAGAGANTLAFAGTTPTITVGSGLSTTISAAITGSNTLTKAGAGELVLSGANTYTGATAVSAGTLTVAGASSLQSATGTFTVSNTGTLSSSLASAALGGHLTINTGGTLDPNGTAAGTFSLASGKNFLMTADSVWALTIASLASFDRITGTGAGGFTINTGAVLDLTGSNLAAGSYQILDGFASGSGSFSILGYDTNAWNVTFDTSTAGIGLLTITAIPEPHEYGLALALFLFAIALRRRKVA